MTLHTPVVAFEATLPAEHARLLRYFNRRVGRDAAPDMAQAVFARLFGSGTLERNDNQPAPLTRIVRNSLMARNRAGVASGKGWYVRLDFSGCRTTQKKKI